MEPDLISSLDLVKSVLLTLLSTLELVKYKLLEPSLRLSVVILLIYELILELAN